jgi:hypothetical protein
VAGAVLLYLVLAVFAGTLIIPFVIGLVKGPDPEPPQPAEPAPMRPLSRVAGIYARYLALYALAAGFTLSHGSRGTVCATGAPVAGQGGGWAPAQTRAGAVLQAADWPQVCAAHPSTAQWIWYLMLRLPGPLLLATVLLMIWQLVREAGRTGPFTPRTTAIMWRLGVVVLAGSVLAGTVSQLGNDLLADALLTWPPFSGATVVADAVISGGVLHGLLPIPALAGAGLLSFARITKAGVALDEEVRATV